jgi:rhodanese-related sulfurtransferase
MENVQSALIELEPGAVAHLLASGEAVLIDVREPEEWSRAHISGAFLHPLSQFDPEEWPRFLGRTAVIACLGGTRSEKVARALLAAGHDRAMHLKGGLEAWRAAGLPVVSDA